MKRRPNRTYFTLLRCIFLLHCHTLAPTATLILKCHYMQGSVTGIVVQGSNGEAQHLSSDERKRVIRLTRTILDAHGFQHVAVIAGTGAQSTRETKQLNIDAKEAAATPSLVLNPPPSKTALTKNLIFRFFLDG